MFVGISQRIISTCETLADFRQNQRFSIERGTRSNMSFFVMKKVHVVNYLFVVACEIKREIRVMGQF